MTRYDRAARRFGVVAPAVSLGGIALAIALTPSFSWASSALSDLGRHGAPAAWAFNGGLILGGLLALPVAWWRARTAANRLGALAAGTLALSALALAAVGVFPAGTPPHFPAALSFYALFTYAMFLDGSARARSGAVGRGLAVIWAAVAHVTGWILWALAGVGGLAVPETYGALVLAGWLAWQSLRAESPMRAAPAARNT
jgi:hypothetical membrane protein